MRIVIDMQGAQTGSRFRGIGRYTTDLVKEIIRQSDQHEIILLLNGSFNDTLNSLVAEFSQLIPASAIRIWFSLGQVSYGHSENHWRREVAEYLRESFIEAIEPDVVLLTTVFEGYGDDFVLSINKISSNIPVVSILYDLIPLLNQDEYLGDATVREWYFQKLQQLKHANLLLAISESSRLEAIELLEFKAHDVVNISSAVDKKFTQICISKHDEARIRNKYGLTREFVMYSGATDPRKNHRRLIQAYSKLSFSLRSTHQLVFVGGMPANHKASFLQVAEECGLGPDELIFTGRVDDEELILIYNICKGFVFPSWHEGFGLPALEAISCGCPVIASSTSSLPEVVGNKDALFDPFDVISIFQKLERLLSDKQFRNNLILQQSEHAKNFSWKNSAEMALKAIRGLHERQKQCSANPQRKIDSPEEEYVRLIDNIASLRQPFSDIDLLNASVAIAHNDLRRKPHKILVDISELVKSDARTGIQRVTRSILEYWLKDCPAGWQVEPVYSCDSMGYRYARSYRASVTGKSEDGTSDDQVKFFSGDIFVGLDLVHPSIIVQNRSTFHKMRATGVRVHFVVYDIIPLLYPEFANVGVPEGHQNWLNVVLENDGAFCISKAVARELDEWIQKNTSPRHEDFRIDWFRLGADIENSAPNKGLPEDAEQVLGIFRKRMTFLLVGTLEPRKGHTQVLDAFEQLWFDDIDVNLAIVGKHGWRTDGLADRLRSHAERNERLFWLEAISDEYLEKIYAASTCLVAASYCEGFGLPLIEAAQHKLPIIARDIPVFREVAGDHAYYFRGQSAGLLAKEIKLWLTLYKAGRFPRSDAMKWLTWRESASNLLQAVMRDVVSSKEQMTKA